MNLKYNLIISGLISIIFQVQQQPHYHLPLLLPQHQLVLVDLHIGKEIIGVMMKTIMEVVIGMEEIVVVIKLIKLIALLVFV